MTRRLKAVWSAELAEQLLPPYSPCSLVGEMARSLFEEIYVLHPDIDSYVRKELAGLLLTEAPIDPPHNNVFVFSSKEVRELWRQRRFHKTEGYATLLGDGQHIAVIGQDLGGVMVSEWAKDDFSLKFRLGLSDPDFGTKLREVVVGITEGMSNERI